MDPKVLITIGFSFAYAFFEVLMNVRQRTTSWTASSDDRGSLWLLYGLITAGYALSFSIGATRIGRIYPWNLFFAIGMALALCGLAIRVHALRTLKQSFSYSVGRTQDQKLIEAGLYRLLRHPGYLGQLLIFLGLAASMSNWLSVLAMLGPVLAGYLYRISVEERFMREQFGEDYLNYQRRTRRLIPLIY